MSVNVFTYGTLAIGEIMAALIGRDLPSEAAVLPGYERFLLTGRIYPGIVASPRAQTAGRLYREVDRRSLLVLDLFEGDTYERRELEVSLTEETKSRPTETSAVLAQVYVIPDERRHLLSSCSWNEATFLARHGARYLERCLTFGTQERTRLGAPR